MLISSGLSGSSELEPPPLRQRRLDSFIPAVSPSQSEAGLKDDEYVGFGRCAIKIPSFVRKIRFPNTIDPRSELYNLQVATVKRMERVG